MDQYSVTKKNPSSSTILGVVEKINDASESIVGYPIITLKYDGSFIDLVVSEYQVWDSSNDKRKVLDKKTGRREKLDAYIIGQVYGFALELIRAIDKADKC